MSNCRHGLEAHRTGVCAHGAGVDGPSALHPDAPKEGSAARAAAVPFGVSPIDETERRERIKRLKGVLDERIVFLDGAMGTMIQ